MGDQIDGFDCEQCGGKCTRNRAWIAGDVVLKCSVCGVISALPSTKVQASVNTSGPKKQ